MRFLPALIPLLLLASCVTDSEPSIHEVNIFGSEYVRITWFYGAPRTLELGDRTIDLERAGGRNTETLAVSEALRVDGQPYLREPLSTLRSAPTEVHHVGGSSDMRVRVGQNAAQVLYYDGDMWFTLLEDASAGANVRVVPTPRLAGLQGIAQLTRAEANAVQAYLETRGPLAVTVLDNVPSTPRHVAGVEEYLRSGFYVQRRIDTLASDQPGTAQSEVFFDVLAGGSQSLLGEGQSFFIIGNEEELRDAWARAHGTLLTPPALPQVFFDRETVLAVSLGTQPTGGYGISVQRMYMEGGAMYADVTVTRPPEGAMTTQALTSPWQYIRILRGNVQSVWLRDSVTGQILGIATRGQP